MKKIEQNTVFSAMFLALILSMLGGRIVWGTVRYIIAGLGGSEFSFAMLAAGAFVEAIPAIICYIIIVPIVVMAFKKSKIMK